MKEISLLLGAGFSVNKGYPTANELNNKIVNLTAEEFDIASQGSLYWITPENTQNPVMSFYVEKMFCLELIKFYCTGHQFNYEEFYDYYTNIRKNEQERPKFESFCDEFRKKYRSETDNHNLLSTHNHIFNQIISALIDDGHGSKFYAEPFLNTNEYPGYTGFLKCLVEWQKEGIIHINTLNHDLFFESFNNTSFLNGQLSTGFHELGSPFYGELEKGYMVRLEQYTGEFDTNLRLYKLHGSFDQYPFHNKADGAIEAYIKIKYRVGVTDLYKEVNDSGKLSYENDFMNYHSDFLSGTTSKILRYGDPVYYTKIFDQFKASLKNSDTLIIIGYGCGDSEINNIIDQNFGGKIFVADPYPNSQIINFCKKRDCTLIIKTPEELHLNDFN